MTRHLELVSRGAAAAVFLLFLALLSAPGCGTREPTVSGEPPTREPQSPGEPRSRGAPTPAPVPEESGTLDMPQPTAPAVVPTAGKDAPPPVRPGAGPESSVPGDGEAVMTDPAKASGDAPTPRGTPAAGAQGQGSAIAATTKRSAAGLPEAITGYSSWFRLPPGSADVPAGPHLGERRAYILLTEQENFPVGTTVKPPLGKDTMLVLEQKEPGKDFISRIDHRVKEESGWKSASFSRAASDKGFAPVTVDEAECSGCHAKSERDSVFSSLKLE